MVIFKNLQTYVSNRHSDPYHGMLIMFAMTFTQRAQIVSWTNDAFEAQALDWFRLAFLARYTFMYVIG